MVAHNRYLEKIDHEVYPVGRLFKLWSKLNSTLKNYAQLFRLPSIKQKAREYTRLLRTLWIAFRDPRMPWFAKALTGLIVAYAMSPIDLIPDFIPLLGYLDDVILLPVGIMLVIKLIPAQVWQDSRETARSSIDQRLPKSKAGLCIILSIWLTGLAVAVFLAISLYPAR